MRTRVLRINPDRPEPEAISSAAAVLRRHGLVAFPTETVYGLGALALSESAVARIFAAKGRPAANPLIVHVAEPSQAVTIANPWPPAASLLAERFWPGPLTLVVRAGGIVPAAVTAGGPTVAVRCPSHAVARALLRETGAPLAAPSANRSQEVSPTRAEHVLASLGGRIELILDGGPTACGIESTVVDVTVDPVRVLRPGPVTAADLEKVLGAPVAPPEAESSQPIRSPGTLGRHYAPRAPLECLADAASRVAELQAGGWRVGWLALAGEAPQHAPGVKVIEMPALPEDYAAALYDALHRLDEAKVDRIVVSLPPSGDRWSAIHDRLQRAAM